MASGTIPDEINPPLQDDNLATTMGDKRNTEIIKRNPEQLPSQQTAESEQGFPSTGGGGCGGG